ncbi:hypothetical protein [Saccharomonospora sp.]|uniref:hypothetical protein n=1 Tax=Saccharomonospora sp. TaxID=33913 RepID=UPI002608C61E|nr:hypothetical protein [Saccharomonospora sp.]
MARHDLALQHDRRYRFQADHAQQVLETLSWLYDAFPADHPFAEHRLSDTVSEIPRTWLLGSSPNGSDLAAGLGIGYTFTGFIDAAVAPGV